MTYNKSHSNIYELKRKISKSLCLAKIKYSEFDINHEYNSEHYNWLTRAIYLLDMDSNIEYKNLFKSLGATKTNECD